MESGNNNTANVCRESEESTLDVLEKEYNYLHPADKNTSNGESTLTAEQQLWAKVHALKGNDQRTALCLSGGGIRSATFCLGVLQGLVEKGFLNKFHYLSTVSGGGYIGSWLSGWIVRQEKIQPDQSKNQKQEETGINAVIQDLAANPNCEPIKHLRAYSNYLSPALGFSADFFTLISIYFRNFLLNWAVLLPALAALLILPRIYLATLVQYSLCDIEISLLIFAIASILIILFLTSFLLDVYSTKFNSNKSLVSTKVQYYFFIASFLLTTLVSVKLSLSGFQHTNYIDEQCTTELRDQYAIFAAPSILGCFWLGITVIVGLSSKITTENYRECWARSGSWWIKAGIAWMLVFMLVIHGPEWLFSIPLPKDWEPTTLGLGGGFLGIVTGLLGYWSKNGATITNRAKGVAAKLGMRLIDLAAMVFVLVTLIMMSYLISAGLNNPKFREFSKQVLCHDCLDSKSTTILLNNVCKQLDPMGNQTSSAPSNRVDEETTTLPPGALSRLHDSEENIEPVTAIATVAEAVIKAAKSPTQTKEEDAKQSTTGAPQTVTSCGGASSLEPAAINIANTITTTASVIRILAANKETDSLVSAANTVLGLAKTEQAIIAALGLLPNDAKVALEKAIESMAIAAESLTKEMPLGNRFIQIHANTLHNSDVNCLILLTIALVAFSLFMSWCVGSNTFSLHRLYGNRLVRAYLGATNLNRNPHWFTGFDPDDNLPMKDLANDNLPSEKRCLFHVVNLTLNLVDAADGRNEWQQRKAASFTVSPLHTGSASLGYQPSENYAGGITLGRAMTVSGAAASPNMGYHTSPFLALVMTLFNIRLGWWAPNPAECQLRWPKWLASILLPFTEGFGPTNAHNPFVYLSDGGHFENLGIYEMVRRRCRRIVAVDATADPEYKFEDLENAVRKIRIDFGISIDFPQGLPTPENVSNSGRHLALGTIRYSDVDKGCGEKVEDGELIYIKPVLSGDEPLDVCRYAKTTNGKQSRFPHQSTADQFFDEAQFESYRMLGYHSIDTGGFEDGNWPYQGQLGKADCDLAGKTDNPAPEKIEPPTASSGISQGMRSLAQGAGLALAVTVGITVAHSLSLGELGFRERDRRLMEQGIPLKIDPPSIVDKLLKQIEEHVEININIKEINKKIDELEEKINKQDPPHQHQEINNIISQMENRLKIHLDNNIDIKLEDIKFRLDKLEKESQNKTVEAIKSLAPRSNIKAMPNGG